MAATHEVRAGSNWRPLSDTTRDPIIAGRRPLPWPSWQRSEDYYTEGALIWLDVDTRIREISGDNRSLDDFARAFFGGEDGVRMARTYSFEDVVDALDAIAGYPWNDFFDAKLNETTSGSPLAGIERGGYRLLYRQEPSPYQVSKEAVFGTSNLLFSIGLSVTERGEIKEVLWESPAYEAALTAGSKIVEVNGQPFSSDVLKSAICAYSIRSEIELSVKVGPRTEQIIVCYEGGHRYPHLEPLDGVRRRLDEILEPL
jgi:predicted metalloprotease with PDZ domain